MIITLNFEDNEYEVYTHCQTKLGTIAKGVDGFYYFWPIVRDGCLTAEVLEAIAKAMNDLNADKEIRER